MKYFSLLLLLTLAFMNPAFGQTIPKRQFDITDLGGVWVYELNVENNDPASQTDWGSKLRRGFRLEISTASDEVILKKIYFDDSELPTTTRLKIDGAGETNFLPDGTSVKSKTQLDNGVLLRERNTKSTWEPSEFPKKITEHYSLSSKGRLLLRVTLLDDTPRIGRVSQRDPVVFEYKLKRKTE